MKITVCVVSPERGTSVEIMSPDLKVFRNLIGLFSSVLVLALKLGPGSGGAIGLPLRRTLVLYNSVGLMAYNVQQLQTTN